MVKRELITEYEKLSTRQRLYQESMRHVNIMIGIGGVLFIFSLAPFIPAMLDLLLSRFFNIAIDFFILWALCIFIGLILLGVGSWIKKEEELHLQNYPQEREPF